MSHRLTREKRTSFLLFLSLNPKLTTVWICVNMTFRGPSFHRRTTSACTVHVGEDCYERSNTVKTPPTTNELRTAIRRHRLRKFYARKVVTDEPAFRNLMREIAVSNIGLVKLLEQLPCPDRQWHPQLMMEEIRDMVLDHIFLAAEGI